MTSVLPSGSGYQALAPASFRRNGPPGLGYIPPSAPHTFPFIHFGGERCVLQLRPFLSVNLWTFSFLPTRIKLVLQGSDMTGFAIAALTGGAEREYSSIFLHPVAPISRISTFRRQSPICFA